MTFECDYIQGAHPDVLKRLVETNMEKMSGYGNDPYCASAKEKIRAACGKPDAEVCFLVGGTQTNQVIIDGLTASYEGVVSAETGHVNVHEAGAIEYSGHKVLTVPEHMGKMDPDELRKYIETFYRDGNHEHMVFPGIVYISHPTEYGTLYTLDELRRLHEVCVSFDIPLFLDGARLGYGLASRETDVTLKDIAEYTDVFYIGGTKVGALCGEAVVFPHGGMPKHFVAIIKQHGALMAKGRLLGVQFDALFTDDLYMRISRNCIDRAEDMKRVFHEKGYAFYLESPTNQQFIILDDEQMKRLGDIMPLSYMQAYDDTHSVIRFATSWATTVEEIEELKEIL